MTDARRSETFDAFMSYSHAAGGTLAPHLQTALQAFAKPWYRRRSLRVFRDETTLEMTAALWPTIEKALHGSKYFILLASPKASGSTWVQQEVEWWLKHRSADRLFVVCTEGAIDWNREAKDFDWATSDALPLQLKSVFADEPLHLDLTWAREESVLSLENARFKTGVARLYAGIKGRSLDDVLGEDIKQHRTTKGLVAGALLMFALLTGLAVERGCTARREAGRATVAAKQATDEATRADRERDVARARQLATEARFAQTERTDQLERSLLLAAEAMTLSPTLAADIALRTALALVPERVQERQLSKRERIEAIALQPNGSSMIVAGTAPPAAGADWPTEIVVERWNESRVLWRQSVRGSGIRSIQFDASGDRVALMTHDGFLSIRNVGTGAPIRELSYREWVSGTTSLARLSPDFKYLATRNSDHRLELRELDSDSLEPVLSHWHRDSIQTMAFDDTGRRLAVSAAGETSVWRLPEGTVDERWPILALDLGFSPNGELALASADGVYLAGADRGAALRPLQLGERIRRVQFSSNGHRLAVVGDRSTLWLWQVQPQIRSLAVIEHRGAIEALAFANDDNVLWTLEENRVARFWAVGEIRDPAIETNHVVTETARVAGVSGALTISVPARTQLLTATNASVDTWNFAPGAEAWRSRPYAHAATDATCLQVVELADGRITWRRLSSFADRSALAPPRLDNVLLSPDGGTLVAAGPHALHIFDTARLDVERSRIGVQEFLVSPALGPLGHAIAFRDGATLRVEPIGPNARLSKPRALGEADEWRFDPDERALAIVDKGRHGMRIQRLDDGQTLGSWREDDTVRHPRFDRSAQYVASLAGKYLKVHRVGDGKLETSRLISGEPVSLEWDPTQSRIAVGTGDRVEVVNWKSGATVASIPHAQPVTAIVYSPDGKLLATAVTPEPRGEDRALFGMLYPEISSSAPRVTDQDYAVRIFETRTWIEVAQVQHNRPVESVVFSADGKRMATTASDAFRIVVIDPLELAAIARSRVPRRSHD